jgi:hypothetical protein
MSGIASLSSREGPGLCSESGWLFEKHETATRQRSVQLHGRMRIDAAGYHLQHMARHGRMRWQSTSE